MSSEVCDVSLHVPHSIDGTAGAHTSSGWRKRAVTRLHGLGLDSIPDWEGPILTQKPLLTSFCVVCVWSYKSRIDPDQYPQLPHINQEIMIFSPYQATSTLSFICNIIKYHQLSEIMRAHDILMSEVSKQGEKSGH